MANQITTLRLVMLFALVASAYHAPPVWQLLNVPALALIFILDGVDGYVARRRHEETTFGALYDVAADRVIEYVLWIALTHLGLAPVWAPMIFCTRGVLVDVIRTHAAARGVTPFGMMHTRAGRWLVAGRFMRVLYAAAKAVTFGWLLLMRPLPDVFPEAARAAQAPLAAVSSALIFATVGLCLLRGVPVIIDALTLQLVARPRRCPRAREAPAAPDTAELSAPATAPPSPR